MRPPPARPTLEPLGDRIVPAFGPLDPSFGTNGLTIVSFGGVETFNDVGRQSDGKIVVAGASAEQFMVARLDANGAGLDPTFGVEGNGRAEGGTGGIVAYALAVLPDDRIVVVGASPDNYLVARYTPDGRLDDTFDGDGFRRYSFDGVREVARAVALERSAGGAFTGRVVVAGSDGDAPDLRAFRLNPDGSVAGTGSAVLTGIQNASSVAVDTVGRVYVGGMDQGTGHAVVARFAAADLAPDVSYTSPNNPAGSGARTVDFGGPNDDITGMALDGDDRLVVVGPTDRTGRFHFAVARLLADGSPDPTFGTGAPAPGQVHFAFGGGGATDFPRGVLIDGTSRIVVAGLTDFTNSPSDFALLRLDRDGRNPETFIQTAGGIDVAHAVIDGGNGTLLVVGTTVANDDGVVMRLFADPSGPVPPPPAPPPPPAAGVLVGGALNGTAAEYTLANGQLQFGRTVAFPTLSGVLHTATADVNGDGTPDYIAATSEGAIARVNILSGTDLTLLSDFFPYGNAFNGGINLAAADFNGDGKADLAVAPDLPTLIGAVAPEVVVFDGASLIVGGFAELARFLGLDDPNGTGTDPNFRGGLRLGAGDVNGDGRPDLLVGAGTGGGPRITVWSGATFTGGGRPSANPLINLFVFESSQRGGAYIAAGDLNQDGFDDLYFGGGPGGSTRIRTVDGRLLFGLPSNQLVALDLDNSASFPAGLLRDNFFAAGGASFRGGVRLAARDVDADGFVDIVTGSGDGAPGSVRVYTAPQLDAARGVADPTSQDPLLPVGSDVLAAGVFVG